MTFRALVCDYDGTLASHDRMGDEIIAALQTARANGLRIILATGRTLFDLTRVCERLDLFDAVVGENGGVTYSPARGVLRTLAPPPPPRLLTELDRRGIPYLAGHVVVGTSRSDEDRVCQALEAARVSLERVYNRGALMLLPAGVTKGTGVQQVLSQFGLSFHDVLAIGDSENDVALFEACGWAAAPGNAVPEVVKLADWFLPGNNGQAVADAILGPILEGRVPVASSPRHRIEIGWSTATGELVTVPARRANVLIQGDPLAGKSWLAGTLVERLLERRHAVCVIDPEGDYRVLAGLPGVTWTEAKDGRSMLGAVDRFRHGPAGGVVVDVSGLPHATKLQVIAVGLHAIGRHRRRIGRPHWVVLDEAHYSLHPEGIGETAFDVADKGVCLVTYRSSWLRPSVLAAVDTVILGRTTLPEELAFLSMFLEAKHPGGGRAVDALPRLPDGTFVLIEAGARGPASFVPAPRTTPHVRHLKKYADYVVAPSQRFLFRQPNGVVVETADSLAAFQGAIEGVDSAVLAHHAAHGDFSRWVLDVFADHVLAGQLRKAESRWLRGELPDLRRTITDSITMRYGAAP